MLLRGYTTIQALGMERVQERTRTIERLQGLAEDQCQDKAIFPCSDVGVPQTRESQLSCYFLDAGCGHRCVDRVLAREGKEEK